MRRRLRILQGSTARRPRRCAATAVALLSVVGATGADGSATGRRAPDAAALSRDADDAPGVGQQVSLRGLGGGDAARRFATAGFSADLEFHLLLAYRVAWTRIAREARCAALFSRLGADGLERLDHSEYRSVPALRHRDRCGTSVAAYTVLGTPTVMLCPAFATLPTPEGARILIHEALHFAGLGEKPANPNAPTSEEINTTVMENCGL